MKSMLIVLIALLLTVSMSAQTVSAETAAATAAPEEQAQNAPATQVPATEAQNAPATQAPATEAQSDWRNILLLGGDSRNKTTYERTDSMIILSISAKGKTAKLTSIMRDTWVSYPGMPGKGKINAANVYGGPDLAMATVNECFGTEIQDYVLINMAGLVDVIDQVGGIDIPVTEKERKWINVYVKDYLKNFGGYDGDTSLKKSGDSVHLNGLLAMTYSRNRYIGTDYARTQRQRRVLLAFLDELRAESPVRQAAVIASAFESVKTNLTLVDLFVLAGLGLQLDSDSIAQYRVPADGTFESGMKHGFWSIRPNFDRNRELLHDFIYGPGL